MNCREISPMATVLLFYTTFHHNYGNILRKLLKKLSDYTGHEINNKRHSVHHGII